MAQRIDEDRGVALVDDAAAIFDSALQQLVQLDQVVPGHSWVDVMPDMPIDVVPEERMHGIRADSARSQKLTLIPRRVVVLGDEADGIEQRKDEDRDEPERQRLSQRVVRERPVDQPDTGCHLERRFEQVHGPLAAVEASDWVEHVEVQETQ